MKKTLIIGISITFLLITSTFLLHSSIAKEATNEPITLGYCPTMKPLAEKIASTNEQVLLVEETSSAQALQQLKSKNIDVALIGRRAEQSEIQTTNERIVGEGYTLVTTTKKFIQENELANIKVHTAIKEPIVRNLLPHSEIQFYATTQEAVTKGLHEAVLINWNEYQDTYELLVVMKGAEKVEEFRIPVLYSNNYNLKQLKLEV